MSRPAKQGMGRLAVYPKSNVTRFTWFRLAYLVRVWHNSYRSKGIAPSDTSTTYLLKGANHDLRNRPP